jgi:hypothetical protein
MTDERETRMAPHGSLQELADELECLLGRAACAELVLRAANGELQRIARAPSRLPGPWKMTVVAGLAGGVSWRAGGT